MSSIFTRIILGEIPCYKLYEDEQVFSFLDINPVARGHALVVPKKEVDYLFDLEDPLYSHLMAKAKVISQAIKQVVPCNRIGVAVVGLEVPHAHVHLIPLNSMADFSFSKPKLNLTDQEFSSLATEIESRVRG